MRSIGGSFLSSGLALLSYLSSFLVSIVKQGNGGDSRGNWSAEDLNKGRLDCLAYFLMCVKWYRYKGTNANTLGVPLEEMQSEKTPV
ncbi:hypothetical protein RHSIM_Rhsim08G0160900 [Rhododendron simsii]|uniref:Uncharacterized protein n=1 Tax=Rhododendron simsii TaxID=118357 RepID=A0A834LIQ3_RHOSS|nr:hypothetical protein RHSIM_Rhsim08G0160900 [Rhododendron simsii]